LWVFENKEAVQRVSIIFLLNQKKKKKEKESKSPMAHEEPHRP
jgi:hypothetical protein